MNVQEMLDQVNMMVPNSLPDSLKISWFNQVQNQLFRDHQVPAAASLLVTEPGKKIYPLPDDCPEDRITQVVLQNRTYPYVPQAADAEFGPDAFCTIVIGQLLIHPVPEQAVNALVYYKPRPVQLSIDELDAVPTFPADYHELLVLGCASRVAKTDPNMLSLASVFDADFLRLADKADRDLTKVKPKATTFVRSWI